MRQRFIFQDTNGITIQEWTIRDTDDAMLMHLPGTIVVLNGKRWEIIGTKRNVPSQPGQIIDPWAAIRIVHPHNPSP